MARLLTMAKGTRDYKCIEGMLKEFKDCDQERKKKLVKVEEKMDHTLEEIRTMIIGMTL